MNSKISEVLKSLAIALALTVALVGGMAFFDIAGFGQVILGSQASLF